METFIFTDGASKGNPGPGGWGAVLQKENSIEELGGNEVQTTNNRMEITAAIRALERSTGNGESNVIVFTDSSYVINGITKWIYGWEKNNWKTKSKTDVLNVDLWKQLHAQVKNKDVTWKYVPGHSDVRGNERANDIAEEFALGKKPELYVGGVSHYPNTLLRGSEPLDINGNNAVLTKSNSAKKRKSGAAYSYISLLNGKIEIHKTWNECKVRVDGKPAKFKKALSKKEEERIINEYKG